MRAALLHIAFCLPWCVTAQTGPAGVGSSTNNVLWLDANYGITQSGGLVSQWNDRSGNSNHALLPGSIPTAKPTFVSSSVNGYPSLDFDGTDDQLWVSDANSLDLIQWHFFIVVTADVQKDYNAWMVKGDDAQENFEMLSYSDGNIHTPIYWTDNTQLSQAMAGGEVTLIAEEGGNFTFAAWDWRFYAEKLRQRFANLTTVTPGRTNIRRPYTLLWVVGGAMLVAAVLLVYRLSGNSRVRIVAPTPISLPIPPLMSQTLRPPPPVLA